MQDLDFLSENRMRLLDWLLMNFRRLNGNTVTLHFPVPNFDDEIEGLIRAILFAKLDLSHGYIQMPLTEEAKSKTALIAQDETGQFECIMFGLTNAPFYFNKLMKKIFGPFGNELALTYFVLVLGIYREFWGNSFWASQTRSDFGFSDSHEYSSSKNVSWYC